MNSGKVNPGHKCQGSALVLAVLALTLLLVTGGALLALGYESRVYQIRTSSDIVARSAADAGLKKALYTINQQLQSGQLQPDNLPQEIDVSLDGTDSKFSYQITPQTGGTFLVQATGTSGTATRTVEATLQASNPFDFALFAAENLDMHNSSLVDWYNNLPGDPPLKIGTNSTNNSAVDLRNSVTINGDVVVGPGGDPDSVIRTKNSTVITGDTYAQTVSADLPSVSIPAYLQKDSTRPKIRHSATFGSSDSGKYESIDLGNSEKLTIKGPVELYITGGLSLGNSAEIEVDDSYPGSKLTIYLAGNLDSKNSSKMNNKTQNPRSLKVYGLDSCTKMDFKNSSELYGLIYAPKADIVFHNSVDIYGSVIGESLDLKNSANVYYDASLREQQPDDDLITLKVNRWSE